MPWPSKDYRDYLDGGSGVSGDELSLIPGIVTSLVFAGIGIFNLAIDGDTWYSLWLPVGVVGLVGAAWRLRRLRRRNRNP